MAKQLVCEAYHRIPCRVEIDSIWSCTSTPFRHFNGVHSDGFTFVRYLPGDMSEIINACRVIGTPT